MKVYICEKCGKEYTHKGNYMKHLKRKTPCNKNLINETEIIQTTTDMSELRDMKYIDLFSGIGG